MSSRKRSSTAKDEFGRDVNLREKEQKEKDREREKKKERKSSSNKRHRSRSRDREKRDSEKSEKESERKKKKIENEVKEKSKESKESKVETGTVTSTPSSSSTMLGTATVLPEIDVTTSKESKKEPKDNDTAKKEDEYDPVMPSDFTTQPEDPASEMALLHMMGLPANFDTSKGKHKTDNDWGNVKVRSQRLYRQYMNRKGGFNRKLDPDKNVSRDTKKKKTPKQSTGKNTKAKPSHK